MITQTTMYNVKNRSSSMVVYRIPETNVRREFAPGEVKRLPFGELESLTYQPGGKELLENFLQIIEEDATNTLNVKREPEYNMSEANIKELLLRGSLDEFLDALDFAPMGVIDLIKNYSVTLPLQDLNKRKALKQKTGFDVDRALVHIEEEKIEENSLKNAAPKQERRVKTEEPAENAPVRRAPSKYNVVKKVEPVSEETES